MDFSEALTAIKTGERLRRRAWAEGVFVFLVNGSRFIVNREPLLSILGEGAEVDYHAHIDMKTSEGHVVPWVCSQEDVMAEDWTLVLSHDEAQ